MAPSGCNASALSDDNRTGSNGEVIVGRGNRSARYFARL
jgi:hypothetical protein